MRKCIISDSLNYVTTSLAYVDAFFATDASFTALLHNMQHTTFYNPFNDPYTNYCRNIDIIVEIEYS